MKDKLYNFCTSYVNDRIARIQKNISGIQESLISETKSSAGDKHETGRAMLQLEREKLGNQLAEAEKMKKLLSKVNIKNKYIIAGLGSLVYTTKSNYFIGISAGEFKNKENQAYCISPHTPIGKLLAGKKAGEIVVFNGQEIVINRVK